MGHPACVLDVRRHSGPGSPKDGVSVVNTSLAKMGGARLVACCMSEALLTMDAAGESITQWHHVYRC